MNTNTSFKTDFIPRNKVKAYATLILAVLGLVFAIFAFGMANDHMTVVHELTEAVSVGPVAVVISAIELFI